jgi:hypothetical protein
MKTKVFDNADHELNLSDAFACDSALWIGSTDHVEMKPFWRICQGLCDTIAVRSGLQAAIQTPTRHPVRRVLITQPNRHHESAFTHDRVPERIMRLRTQYPDAKILVLRGSMVAPTVQLPAVDPIAINGWVESVSYREAESFLPYWLADEPSLGLPSRPLIVVAATSETADAIISSIALVAKKQKVEVPWMTWRPTLASYQTTGIGNVLWDDSAAPPASSEIWRRRIQTAPSSRHVWATGTANHDERDTAVENGIAAIVEKPGRWECLLSAVAVV